MQNRVYSTKAIVETGIISGIIIVLMLITGYIPVLGAMGILILPIPVTMLYIRHGYKVAILSIVISTFITALMYDPFSALLSALSFGLVGMTLGYCIKNEIKVSITILLLSVVSLVSILLNIFLPLIFIQKDSIAGFFTKSMNMLDESLKVSAETAKSLYKNMGLSQDQLQKVDEITSMFSAKSILRVLGASLIIYSFIGAYFNYMFSKFILKKFKYEMKPMTPFSMLYLDSRVGMMVLLPVLIGMILMKKSVPIGEYIFFSAQMIMLLVFLIIGISVAVYFLKNKFKLQKPIIILIIIFTALNPLFSQIYFFAGLIDMIMDFRRINPNRIFKI